MPHTDEVLPDAQEIGSGWRNSYQWGVSIWYGNKESDAYLVTFKNWDTTTRSCAMSAATTRVELLYV